jgi:hypothetical protein
MGARGQRPKAKAPRTLQGQPAAPVASPGAGLCGVGRAAARPERRERVCSCVNAERPGNRSCLTGRYGTARSRGA